MLYNNTCISECPEGTTYHNYDCINIGQCDAGEYFSFTRNRCKDCVDNCKNCTKENNCFECYNGFRVETSIYYSSWDWSITDICVEDCTEGVDCPNCAVDNCMQCSKYNRFNCIVCEDGYYMNYWGNCKELCPEENEEWDYELSKCLI